MYNFFLAHMHVFNNKLCKFARKKTIIKICTSIWQK